MWTYTLFLLTVFFVPTVVLGIVFRDRLDGTLRTYLGGIGAAYVFGIPMEYYFVEFSVLYHEHSGILGPELGGVPLEAFFFYLAISVLTITLTLIVLNKGEKE